MKSLSLIGVVNYSQRCLELVTLGLVLSVCWMYGLFEISISCDPIEIAHSHMALSVMFFPRTHREGSGRDTSETQTPHSYLNAIYCLHPGSL